jgi:hypothetical protein
MYIHICIYLYRSNGSGGKHCPIQVSSNKEEEGKSGDGEYSSDDEFGEEDPHTGYRPPGECLIHLYINIYKYLYMYTYMYIYLHIHGGIDRLVSV